MTYLSSPSIRYKIFHPLFLFFKFFNVLKIYLNQDYIKNDEFVIKNIQKQIYVQFINRSNKEYEQKPILVVLSSKDPRKSYLKNIIKYLKCLDSPPIYFSIDQLVTVPPNFFELQYSDKLVQQYKEYQPYLSFVQVVGFTGQILAMHNYISHQTNTISDYSSIKQHFHTCSFQLKPQKQNYPHVQKVHFVKCVPYKQVNDKLAFITYSDSNIPTMTDTQASFTQI